jgi:predicted component of type VI protein secretion system
MSWAVHIRAAHPERGQALEQRVDSCPAILGRDRAVAACALEGDDSVSKVHASIDVRGNRLMVRDVRSMNGTFTTAGRLEPDRWVDVGPADAENELRIGGWRLHVRATRSLPFAPGATPPSGSQRTVLEAAPFGASQRTTDGAEGLTSFAGVVDRLSEPVYALRVAQTALDQALARAMADVVESDRAALREMLGGHYPELKTGWAEPASRKPAEDLGSSTPADAAALAIVKELSFRYTGRGELTTAADLASFKRRVRSGIDAFVHGLVQALAGVNAYVDEMNVSPGASTGQLPRTEPELGFAVFGARSDAGEGAEIVRRAFHEIAIHQVASFNATLSGVRELLGELSPEAIESTVSRELERDGFWRRLWGRFFSARRFLESYRRRHRDLSTEENTRFALIFGRRFADEYHSIVRETRSSSAAQGAAAALSSPASKASVSPSVHARGGTAPLDPPIVPPVGNPNASGTVPFAPALQPRGTRADGGAR